MPKRGRAEHRAQPVQIKVRLPKGDNHILRSWMAITGYTMQRIVQEALILWAKEKGMPGTETFAEKWNRTTGGIDDVEFQSSHL